MKFSKTLDEICSDLDDVFGAGDKAVQTEQGVNMVYIHAGTNPFDTITQAIKYEFLSAVPITKIPTRTTFQMKFTHLTRL